MKGARPHGPLGSKDEVVGLGKGCCIREIVTRSQGKPEELHPVQEGGAGIHEGRADLVARPVAPATNEKMLDPRGRPLLPVEDLIRDEPRVPRVLGEMDGVYLHLPPGVPEAQVVQPLLQLQDVPADRGLSLENPA